MAKYNVVGKQIRIVTNNYQTAGIHEINFDGSSLPPGIYCYTLEFKSKANQYLVTKKIIKMN